MEIMTTCLDVFTNDPVRNTTRPYFIRFVVNNTLKNRGKKTYQLKVMQYAVNMILYLIRR